ncbi:endonuclease MutS2 [Bacillus carboniphilus]|uniref:Endonuclease MutS2 n=1 Tax=Bacillus carboniphilus TaxID=86663 RepID=A0ABY9JY33_9BACI|nr:endonuclease MutS2 [Bacillus carboniphilus]WLR43442.1 endonuclease MutS2 [Bacillus carboniphilus]
MNEQTYQLLGFNEIKNQVAQHALTEEGKRQIQNLVPSTSIKQIEAWLNEVEEAVNIIEKSSSVPVHGLNGVTFVLDQLNKGILLRPEQLMKIHSLLDSCTKLKRYMRDKEFLAPRISTYVYAIEELPDLANEIRKCIKFGKVDDYASKQLLKIRKQIKIEEERLKEKVQHILQSKKYKSYLQESLVSQRGERYVIPIKKEYRRKVEGAVVDTSASGSTLYLEPVELSIIQERINRLTLDEEIEVDSILSYLTGLVESHQREIHLAVDIMIQYDVLFAKGKYSVMIDGKKAKVNESHFLSLQKARHPLLGKEAIPLTVELGNDLQSLVITGPNTGGKTVTIKTVGLLTLMTQCGLLIPVEGDSHVPIFQRMFIDIGDGQSIEQNLSTFSSRIKNVIDILVHANDRSLILIDELGSGTDPGEGMGLAIAILEQLHKKGAMIFATTHFSEMKDFASDRKGFINGSMEFDLETLLPTYRLLIGQGGDSQAFSIALKLGMHPKIVEKAHLITYRENKIYTNNNPETKRAVEKQVSSNRHVKKQIKEKSLNDNKIKSFIMGDNVKIGPKGDFGIVYTGPDQQGNYIVQVKDEKIKINHKRLTLYIASKELYPDDYDFDIIFKSKEYRKLNHSFNRKHMDGVSLEHEE